jgi:riboflavin synthase
MFTGIVEEAGRLEAFAPGLQGWRLEVDGPLVSADAQLGDSIAVNGCCLTVAGIMGSRLHFDVLEETRRLTNFSGTPVGGRLNLERSLSFGGKVGGHFVTGHIDALGIVDVLESRGTDHYLRVRLPAETARYLISKGSIAIDGVSLTVAEVEEGAVAVWLIPHTLAVTGLRDKRAGDAVNLEFDLLGKYVEKLLLARSV